ncbi:cystatin-8-like isoform X1 [Hyaena hyaena]|uniref:cystatin-8-like isoform X1 n=1 Tax=Hyaena hyaena TaxID=95912 RepID=UPI0019224707|nr:cystatin-8-like isoform X1 [Hyaena hyaena]XP_039076895.1 cystatin-8-like isoform X1 [Hyaena hyaena]XP_039076896.1 cystatin-8-like isoform X1 [Hyaena hyaena]XP_039076897.1 cystatin-8-like isoform X1 [Hyaena hyaena]
MTRSWGFCLVLLTVLVALVASTDPGKNKGKVLRELKVINASNANVKQCLWFAMQEYNKESEDKYLFQVIKTVQVQLQVTDHLEYFIDVEIARSNCRKVSNSTENCIIQENTKLEKARRAPSKIPPPLLLYAGHTDGSPHMGTANPARSLGGACRMGQLTASWVSAICGKV